MLIEENKVDMFWKVFNLLDFFLEQVTEKINLTTAMMSKTYFYNLRGRKSSYLPFRVKNNTLIPFFNVGHFVAVFTYYEATLVAFKL